MKQHVRAAAWAECFHCCWVTRRSDRRLLFLRRRQKGNATYLSPECLRRRRKADYFHLFVLQNQENQAAVFNQENGLLSCEKWLNSPSWFIVVNSLATARAPKLIMRLNYSSARRREKISSRTCWRAVRGHSSWQRHPKRLLTKTTSRIYNNKK